MIGGVKRVHAIVSEISLRQSVIWYRQTMNYWNENRPHDVQRMKRGRRCDRYETLHTHCPHNFTGIKQTNYFVRKITILNIAVGDFLNPLVTKPFVNVSSPASVSYQVVMRTVCKAGFSIEVSAWTSTTGVWRHSVRVDRLARPG